VSEVRELTELITCGPAEALAGLLGVPMPDLEAGQGLPLLWHWMYLLDRPPQAALGADGHPVRGVKARCQGSATTPTGWSRHCSTGRASSCPPQRTGDAVRVTTRDSADRTTAADVIQPGSREHLAGRRGGAG